MSEYAEHEAFDHIDEHRRCTCERRFASGELVRNVDCPRHGFAAKSAERALTTDFVCPIVGIEAMHVDLDALWLSEGVILELERERDNAVDRNALKVMSGDTLVGYLPAEIAYRMRDEKIERWRVVVAQILRHKRRDAGLRVRLQHV